MILTKTSPPGHGHVQPKQGQCQRQSWPHWLDRERGYIWKLSRRSRPSCSFERFLTQGPRCTSRGTDKARSPNRFVGDQKERVGLSNEADTGRGRRTKTTCVRIRAEGQDDESDSVRLCKSIMFAEHQWGFSYSPCSPPGLTTS
jgi:hypothetical protein